MRADNLGLQHASWSDHRLHNCACCAAQQLHHWPLPGPCPGAWIRPAACQLISRCGMPADEPLLLLLLLLLHAMQPVKHAHQVGQASSVRLAA